MRQTLTITSPANKATLNGIVTVSASVSNVAKVYFAVDGHRVETDTAAPFQCVIDTTKLANGPHTIKATSGNGKVSQTITVTVANYVTTVSGVLAAGQADFTVKAA